MTDNNQEMFSIHLRLDAVLPVPEYAVCDEAKYILSSSEGSCYIVE